MSPVVEKNTSRVLFGVQELGLLCRLCGGFSEASKGTIAGWRWSDNEGTAQGVVVVGFEVGMVPVESVFTLGRKSIGEVAS